MTSIVIGVAGGSGSGKTTVVGRLVESLGPERTSVIAHDRYYRARPSSNPDERAAVNYDHPDALETRLLVQHVETLRSGRPVDVPVYDFSRHARGADRHTIHPHPAIIVEGILVLADPELRRLMDIKVFVDADDKTRFQRRLHRDVSERGRTRESVSRQYDASVRPMHLAFVEPSRCYADVVVHDGGHNLAAIDALLRLIETRTRGSARAAIQARSRPPRR